MALTGMSVKDWREALDFSTRKVKAFLKEILEFFEFIIMLRKEDLGEWRTWLSTSRS